MLGAPIGGDAVSRRWNECGRKQRYATDTEAQRMIAHARRHSYEASADLRVYPCPHCKGFHLTSTSLTGRARQQPTAESLEQRIERQIHEARVQLHADRAKGWPVIVHETRIAQLREELAALRPVARAS